MATKWHGCESKGRVFAGLQRQWLRPPVQFARVSAGGVVALNLPDQQLQRSDIPDHITSQGCLFFRPGGLLPSPRDSGVIPRGVDARLRTRSVLPETIAKMS